MLRTGLVLAAALLAVGADTAMATPVSGSIVRVGENHVRIAITNNGSAKDIAVRVELPAGIKVLSASAVQGPPANCSTSMDHPNRIDCFFDPDPALAPGETTVIEVFTDPRLPDNAGANAYSCGIPCDPNNMSGPYALTGPAPAGGADLGVTMAELDLTPLGAPLVLGSVGGFVEMHADLTNHGEQTAVRTMLSLDIAGEARHSGVFVRDSRPPLAQTACSGLPGGTGSLCNFGQRQKGDVDRLSWVIGVNRPGAITFTATASSDTPDPGPNPNVAKVTKTIDAIPDADFNFKGLGGDLEGFAGFLKVFTGNTEAARAVDIGILRITGSARLAGTPASGSSHARARASAASCQWVKNKRVRFRREKGRRCDEPSYLRAPVKRGKFKLRLRKRLPKGKYVAFVRAIGRDGIVEGGVSKRDKNLKTFRVRR